MYTHKTNVLVKNLSAHSLYEFMLRCTDEQYATWWPGTHFAFHTIKREPNDVGSLVYLDEMVGARRLKYKAVVIEANPDRKITWQMKKLVKLPGYLSLELQDTDAGVDIRHTLSIGYDNAFSRVFIDPLVRLYANKQFEADLADHAETEFNKLAELLATKH